MRRHWKLVISFHITFLSIILSSCANFAYYGQSLSGQLEILEKRRSIDKILSDPTTPRDLKKRLEQVHEITEFANRALYLPAHGSYRTYADLSREYVVWNVVAAPAFSLAPLRWCFLIVGCLPYRGYFAKQDAIRFAGKLRARGYDVHFGGVSAYSTLGWFDDPVLNTMLRRDRTEWARVIFHELAHQKIYIKNDTGFNEAFADSIALVGVRRWLHANYPAEALHRFERAQHREEQFLQLVFSYRRKLEALYASDLPVIKKRSRKSAIFKFMLADYRKMRARWGDHDEYDAWFENGLNNARLATLLTYRDLVPGFLALLQAVDNNLQEFYDRVAELGHCSKVTRRHILEEGPVMQECKEQ
ncbi:MAG: aminopeptidase [Gammaproteobacteria bacterium]